MSFDLKKFREDTGGTSVYLKAKDFADEGRRVGIIPWIYDGKVVPFLGFYEGWQVLKEKNDRGKIEEQQRPIRFTQEQFVNNDIDPDIVWAMSSFKNQSPKPQTPKPTFAFIVKDYETMTIKVCSFNQATIVNSILNYLDEESKFYEPNIGEKDIIISKADERTWKVEIRDGQNPEWVDDALSSFTWDWELFMEGEDPTNSNIKHSNFAEDKPKAKKQTSTKSNKSVKKDEPAVDKNDDWTKVKAPSGRFLSDLTADEVDVAREYLEKNKKTTGASEKLYKAVCAAQEHHKSLESDEEVGF